MADELKKIVCCILLLAIVGVVSGVGFIVLGQAGIAAPGKLVASDSPRGDSGLTRVIGETSSTQGIFKECHFPIWNLPAYYICIMFCKIGGGGDSCAPTCEARLSICT
jgi:hypothetical protein